MAHWLSSSLPSWLKEFDSPIPLTLEKCMSTFVKATGIIMYDPWRGDMKHRTNWWCIVNTDNELTRYYRWWLQREKHIHLQPPSWGAHVSVIRGEKPSHDKMHLWKKYHGQPVEFLIDVSNYHVGDDNQNGGQYYWLTVECPFLNQMRAEFGFPRGWRLHLTIGRTHDYQARVPKNLRK